MTAPATTDLAIVGPTCSGKTALALALFESEGDAELVSVDAMAVYRGLDVGTDKPLGTPASWHLIDVADPNEEFSVARFQSAAREAIDAIHRRGHRAVLVGGTGLYHRAVIDCLELPGRYPEVAASLRRALDEPGALAGLYARLEELDPLAASRIEPANERRIVRALEVTLGSGQPFSSFGAGLERYEDAALAIAGLRLDRAEMDRRVEARLDAQLERGFVDEVRALAAGPGGLSRTARQAIGYAELLAYVRGELSLDEARSTILRRLKNFARRQESWFRRDPRVVWFDADDPMLAERVTALWTGFGATEGERLAWETAAR